MLLPCSVAILTIHVVVIVGQGLPNFLAGLDRQTTMAFYEIETGLNLTKSEIVQRKQEWAKQLPPRNRALFLHFNELTDAARSQLEQEQTRRRNDLSPDTGTLVDRIRAILGNYSLTREEEATAIDRLLAASPAAAQNDLPEATF